MQTQIDTTVPTKAVAFYHEKGLVPAWKNAQRFAGDSGRIGTLPDLIDARLATNPDTLPWSVYFTTRSAEYLGFSKGGVPIIIVAHGVGPMATLDGALAAYKYEFGDKTRSHRGGRISAAEFHRLEDGEYGPVEIVPFDQVTKWHRYPFYHFMTATEALHHNPLVRARLGPRAGEYVMKHLDIAVEDLRRQCRDRRDASAAKPHFLMCGDAPNCGYEVQLSRSMFPGHALAHLLSMGGLMNSHLSRNDYPDMPTGVTMLGCEVDCHEWWNGTRLFATNGPGTCVDIGDDFDVHRLFRQHWRQMLRPTVGMSGHGFYALKRIGKHWFTQYPKSGDGMDTGAPEFQVTAMEQIPGPSMFTTTMVSPFFKYDIREVQAIAPHGANAYHFPSHVVPGGRGAITPVEFYRVSVDTSQQMMRQEELANDYDLLAKLAALPTS